MISFINFKTILYLAKFSSVNLDLWHTALNDRFFSKLRFLLFTYRKTEIHTVRKSMLIFIILTYKAKVVEGVYA